MIRRFKIGLAITLGTFIIGAVSALLWVINKQHSTKPSPPVPPVAIRQAPHHPDAWEKIDVDGKLSFYLPPDMEQEEELVGNFEYLGPHKSFESKTLSFTYVYVEKQHNEELWRKLTCELLTREPEGEPNVRTSEVEINGRSARQSFWHSDKLELSVLSLCFPDVGGGTILMLRGIPKDHKDYQVLDAAKQIFSSIEFP